jgi:hypothetical protein
VIWPLSFLDWGYPPPSKVLQDVGFKGVEKKWSSPSTGRTVGELGDTPRCENSRHFQML